MNLKKKLVALANILVLAGAPLTQVSAQSYDEAFFQELNDANKDTTSVSIEGMLTASTSDGGQHVDFGKFDFSSHVDINAIEASFTGNLTSLFLGAQTLNFNLFLKNSVAYIGYPNSEMNGIEWTATDFTEAQADIKKAIDEGTETANTNIDQFNALAVKYSEVEELGDEYIVKLKDNINTDELWTDLNALVNLDMLKEELKKQVEAESGEVISDEQLSQIDEVYTKENLEMLLKFNPKFEVHYDKTTKLAKKVVFSMAINLSEIANATDSETLLENMPQVINIESEFNFSNHNQPVTVDVPQEALDAPVDPMRSPDVSNTEETTAE